MPTCRGTTQKGLPCRQSAGASGYCHLHAPARAAAVYPPPPNVRTYPHTYAPAREPARGTAVTAGERRTSRRFLLAAGVAALALVGVLSEANAPAEPAAYARPAPLVDSTAMAARAAAEATADSLDEARLVDAARAIPGSDLDGNRTAYATLAARYPKNPDYARRRDDYAGRIETARVAEERRVARRAARRYSAPTRGGGGASAQCRDGSLSYSAHRSGTCSRHGGVAVWY